MRETLSRIREKYTDKFGLVVTSQMDGGDTSHKVSHLTIAQFFSFWSPLSTRVQLLRTMAIQVWILGLIRHPDPDKWYSNPKTFSRDQFTPRVIVAALTAQFGDTTILKSYFQSHLRRLLLVAWNTQGSWNEKATFKLFGFTIWEDFKCPDFTGPENWGFYIRGFRIWWLYPLLFIFDLETLVNAVIKRFDSDFDINNGLAAQLLAMEVMPTGIGRLSYTIMKPVVEKKLLQYWDKDRYEPPIGELYIEALKARGLL